MTKESEKLRINQGDIVRHYKGREYRVLRVNVEHTERKEFLVIYMDSDNKVWARPQEMFMGKEDNEYRFKKIGEWR